VYVYVYVGECMYEFIYVSICMHMYEYVYMYLYIYISTGMYLSVCLYVCNHLSISLFSSINSSYPVPQRSNRPIEGNPSSTRRVQHHHADEKEESLP
jgi:hypothetical protein